MNLNLPLSLYYETCDEGGMVDPYFTGDITDSEGRTICRADSEGKALDLIGGFDDLLANIEALRAQLAESERRRVELVEVVHKAMDRTVDCDKKHTDEQLIADVAYLKRLASDYFNTSVGCGNRAFAAEQKYDTLVDAVKKEHRAFDALDDAGFKLGPIGTPIWTDHAAARADVDRLIATADCEGEG